MIDQILRKIPERKRKKMNYVHLGGIQILVKSTFKEGKSQKYIKELLSKKLASGNTYQKGSMDEILIQKFLEKQKMKEKDLYDQEENLESKDEEINSESKDKEEQKNE